MTSVRTCKLVWAAIFTAYFFVAENSLAQQIDNTLPIVEVERVFVKSFQEMDVPALKSGLLEEIVYREGSIVQSGEIVAKLQDQQAVLALQQAQTQSKIAKHLADNRLELETAEKKLQQAAQAVKQQDLVLQAARMEAENLLRTQAAEKNQAVAKNEYERAKQSRARFVDSVSESELDGLRLTFERAELDTAQAVFDLQLARLKATAAEEALQTLQLAVETAKVEVAQAQSKVAIAGFNSELKQAELDAASLHLDHHKLRSKLGGVVVDVYRQPGEWVEPGESVLRILRLSRLRAEAFVRVDSLPLGIENTRAELEVMFGDKPHRFEGLITFVSPEIDPINRETSLWMEFENRELLVKPGMQGSLKIYANKIAN